MHLAVLRDRENDKVVRRRRGPEWPARQPKRLAEGAARRTPHTIRRPVPKERHESPAARRDRACRGPELCRDVEARTVEQVGPCSAGPDSDEAHGRRDQQTARPHVSEPAARTPHPTPSTAKSIDLSRRSARNHIAREAAVIYWLISSAATPGLSHASLPLWTKSSSADIKHRARVGQLRQSARRRRLVAPCSS